MEENNNNKEKTIEVGYISFTIPISLKEAKAVLHKPKTKLAKDLNKYLHAVLVAGCKKMIEEKNSSFVNKCELNVNEELKDEQ